MKGKEKSRKKKNESGTQKASQKRSKRIERENRGASYYWVNTLIALGFSFLFCDTGINKEFLVKLGDFHKKKYIKDMKQCLGLYWYQIKNCYY